MDLFPRVDLFERSGIGYDAVDHILCNIHPRSRPTLEQLGVPLSKVIWVDGSLTYRTDRLLVTTFPGLPMFMAPWSVQFLRERLGVAPLGSHRRLYIPRRTHRLITNETDLLRILARHDFEEFDPGRTPQLSKRTFAAADMIVGAHGAGLTDMIFSPPGSSVFEFIPSFYAKHYYIAMAAAAGIDHRYILIESSMQTSPGGKRGQLADTTVDLDVFTVALEEMIAEAT